MSQIKKISLKMILSLILILISSIVIIIGLILSFNSEIDRMIQTSKEESDYYYMACFSLESTNKILKDDKIQCNIIFNNNHLDKNDQNSFIKNLYITYHNTDTLKFDEVILKSRLKEQSDIPYKIDIKKNSLFIHNNNFNQMIQRERIRGKIDDISTYQFSPVDIQITILFKANKDIYKELIVDNIDTLYNESCSYKSGKTICSNQKTSNLKSKYILDDKNNSNITNNIESNDN
ncbi:MAG: hypothetical protein IKE70_05710 [Bacilli bacterium]|nr:hypothetical protein [Bacilli bacterium]